MQWPMDEKINVHFEENWEMFKIKIHLHLQILMILSLNVDGEIV